MMMPLKRLGTRVGKRLRNFAIQIFFKRPIKEVSSSGKKMEPDIPALPGGISVTRSIHAVYKDKFNRSRQKSLDSVFKIDEQETFASQRYSAPGERALYTVEGVGEDARKLSLKDIGWNQQSVVLTATAVIHPKKILVIGPELLQSMNLSMSEVTGENYQVTQMLGYFAKKHGFDAIRAPSIVDPTMNNIILFESIR